MTSVFRFVTDDNHDRREQLEERYQRALDQLANATATYESVREMSNASERQLRQAEQREQQAQQQLVKLRRGIEQLEDDEAQAF